MRLPGKPECLSGCRPVLYQPEGAVAVGMPLLRLAETPDLSDESYYDLRWPSLRGHMSCTLALKMTHWYIPRKHCCCSLIFQVQFLDSQSFALRVLGKH